MTARTFTGVGPGGEVVEVEIPDLGRPGCANCAFVAVVLRNGIPAFECRRTAPQPQTMGVDPTAETDSLPYLVALWPRVLPSDWCGVYCSREEYAANEQARRQAIGAAQLLRDLFDPEKTPPENLNG